MSRSHNKPSHLNATDLISFKARDSKHNVHALTNTHTHTHIHWHTVLNVQEETKQYRKAKYDTKNTQCTAGFKQL